LHLIDAFDRYGPWALIAGGSEGVGAAFARKLAARGLNLVLLARKPEPLEALAREVTEAFTVQVRTLAVDLIRSNAFDLIRQETADIEVGLLIHNAGAENMMADFLDRELANAERMIMLNVTGPTRLCHHFGTLMRGRGRGGIILVGTLGGYAGGPRLAIYCGTKAFTYILAESLWFELRPYNVDVLGLVLGTTRTPALARMGMADDIPGFAAAEPDAVAQEGLEHLANGPIWHANGTEAIAQTVRAMPRGQAVAMIHESSQAMAKGSRLPPKPKGLGHQIKKWRRQPRRQA
jgi:short-subunit dehydrogenase